MRCLSLLNDEEAENEAINAGLDDDEDDGGSDFDEGGGKGAGGGGGCKGRRRRPPPSPSAAPMRFDRPDDVYAEVDDEEAALAQEVRARRSAGKGVGAGSEARHARAPNL